MKTFEIITIETETRLKRHFVVAPDQEEAERAVMNEDETDVHQRTNVVYTADLPGHPVKTTTRLDAAASSELGDHDDVHFVIRNRMDAGHAWSSVHGWTRREDYDVFTAEDLPELAGVLSTDGVLWRLHR